MEPQDYEACTETVLIRDVSQSRQLLLEEYFSAEERDAMTDVSDRTIAGLIAAKRAVSRSLDGKNKPWHDILLSHDERGKPFVRHAPSVNDICGHLLSITHTRWAARAFVIPLREDHR